MEITHNQLVALGLFELYNRPARYEYKGVTGRFYVDEGTFHFHGFGPTINTISDLQFLLKLIDYQYKETAKAYSGYELSSVN